MVKETVEIEITKEMQVRPVAMLVQLASKYDASIYIESGTKSFNAKSIMGMMTLGLCLGDKITVVADGRDEQEALAALTGYLAGKTAV